MDLGLSLSLGEEKSIFFLPIFEAQFLGCPGHGLITILATIFRLTGVTAYHEGRILNVAV
jgi:hypothetical protein